MKVLIISCIDINSSGRVLELIETARLFGEVELLIMHAYENKEIKIELLEEKNYYKFIKEAIKCFKKRESVYFDIVLSCDSVSMLLAYIIKKIFLRHCEIWNDCPELHIYKDTKSNKLKCLRMLERILIPKMQVLSCANKERARIMKSYYNLSKTPIDFDNIFFLNSTYDKKKLDQKYASLFSNSKKIYIISSAGMNLRRMNDLLFSAIAKLGENYRLIVVGTIDEEAIIYCKKLQEEYHIDNIKAIGKVSRNDLAYLIEKSDVGVSTYLKCDLNNIYCASGKIYEYFQYGKPVVVSDNPPLKYLCDHEKVGVATDDLFNGIKRVCFKYNYYKKNVIRYRDSISLEARRKELYEKVKKEITIGKIK